MVSGLFHRGTVISKIKDEELRTDKIRLEMAQARGFKTIEEAENEKSTLFKQMLTYPDKARQEAVANRISAIDTKVRLEQGKLRQTASQLKMLYTVESIRGAQRGNVNSPVLRRLMNVRPEEVNKTMMDIVANTRGLDETMKVLLGDIGFAMPESDKDVQDLVKLVQTIRQETPNDPDLAAENARLQWNKQKGLDTAETA